MLPVVQYFDLDEMLMDVGFVTRMYIGQTAQIVESSADGSVKYVAVDLSLRCILDDYIGSLTVRVGEYCSIGDSDARIKIVAAANDLVVALREYLKVMLELVTVETPA